MVAVALRGLGGSSLTSGNRKNRHSHAPWISPHFLRMVYPEGSNIMTVFLEKSTLQSASQKGNIPTSELLKLIGQVGG